MNLLTSYHWLKEHVRTKLSPEEFAARLSLCGPGVERWHCLDESLDGVVVGEIIEFHKHPNADKLSVAKVDVGRVKPLQLLFGQMVAMHVGDKIPVAVAPTVLPGGRKIEKAKMRGEISEGMLCLDQELGLLKEGVSIRYFDAAVANGTPIAKALELDDTIFDIEVTSNRPDAFSMVGLAREASAILGAPFVWKPAVVRTEKREQRTELEIKIEAPNLCSRYQAAVMTNVQVKPSPWWMQKRLIAAGIRPISNIVDITNYVMLELGQPMHAFDAEKLEARSSKLEIKVRQAVKGEMMKALDGKTYALDPSMLVIADAKRPVAIAGVMGGEETGVTRDTNTVIFEAATFDPVSVRRTARALNLHSDSSLRFEKGLSSETTTAALARAVELATQIADATLSSPLLDRRVRPYKALKLPWDPAASRALIGVDIPTAKMKSILTSLGFAVAGKGKQFQVTVPYWRDHDIEASVDFTEEIARIYGYHKLPSQLPHGELLILPEESELVWEDHLREAFQGAGFTETYSYSFVSRALLEKGGCGNLPALAVQNPLTSDLELMRPSLIPSVLQIVAENEPMAPGGSIFEIAKVYEPQPGDLPKQILKVVAAVWGDDAVFSRAKGMMEFLCDRFHARVETSSVTELSHVLHPGRRIAYPHVSGVVGEVHPAVRERFGITHRAALIEFEVLAFASEARGTRYEPVSSFPPVRRDISLFVARTTTHDVLVTAMRRADTRLREVELFDVYEGRGVPEGKKSTAFHLTFADPSCTLTGAEADEAFTRVSKALETQLAAEVRKV